ncbi:hypothetical protein C3942_06730 [Solimonas fluminis]|uniref:BcpO-related WXXGXW repeat protein n=1 Tax=Solimonas fluminis TaxID=2086571 RepID=A0A2S5THN8_9GAMM|nr:hypothetical protein [Solimonas fluminis]PPE74457.1 hypothetical protein C3942_06730 [Solimonas fluminis]
MNRKLLAPLVLALGATLLPLEAAFAHPPDWAPAHGYRAKHRYMYYPSHQIYYEPASTTWFWLDGGNWRFGASLPVYYQQYTRGGVWVDLDEDRPYHQHDYVVRHYGRPRPVVVEHHYHDRPRKVVVEHRYDDDRRRGKDLKHHKRHKHDRDD